MNIDVQNQNYRDEFVYESLDFDYKYDDGYNGVYENGCLDAPDLFPRGSSLSVKGFNDTVVVYGFVGSRGVYCYRWR